MSANPPSFAKRLLFYGITVVMVLLLFELFSRAYYYHYLSRHPVAFIQVLKDVKNKARAIAATDTLEQRDEKVRELLRPGFPKAESIEINREQGEANRAVYKPWVEFAFRDFAGKYINVTDHIRKSLPDRSDSLAKDAFTIWFLGGSTMYGFNVTDAETIPAAFVRAYRLTHPGGRPIRVFNLGMPFYYSYQELIMLTDRLFRGQKPDMIVMLDGLNECISANNSVKRVPAFAIGKGDSYRPGAKEDAEKQLEDFPEMPPDMSVDSASKIVSGQYLENIRHAHDLAGLYHIPVYCFWQPVPYYNYPNRFNDPFCSHAQSPRFERIYALVRDNGAVLPWFFFLGDMLKNEKGLPFIDQIHYSPQFSSAVAEKMLSLLPL